MKDLSYLLAIEEDASEELLEELEKQYPVGTRVSFMIMYGQKNPSTGVVISYRGHGYLAIKHDQAKKYSRYAVRNVFFENTVKI